MPEKTSDIAHTHTEITAWLASNLPHWTLAAGTLRRTFRTEGWKGTMMVANAVAHLAEAAWHHPELILNYASVEIRLSTHTAHGITDKDYALARKIEEFISWQPGKEGGPLEGTPSDDARYAYVKYEGVGRAA
jgi:4a-hydroxytetrahydrobiopterin dehydratase